MLHGRKEMESGSREADQKLILVEPKKVCPESRLLLNERQEIILFARSAHGVKLR
jgi:hypothetical protein